MARGSQKKPDGQRPWPEAMARGHGGMPRRVALHPMSCSASHRDDSYSLRDVLAAYHTHFLQARPRREPLHYRYTAVTLPLHCRYRRDLDVNRPTRQKGWAPLHLAARHGHAEVRQVSLVSGC